jgi:hypothetical protein
MTKPWVIVEEGLVQSQSDDVVVIDLDFMDLGDESSIGSALEALKSLLEVGQYKTAARVANWLLPFYAKQEQEK